MLRARHVAGALRGRWQQRRGLGHVLACATELRQETAILQRSCTRGGLAFHLVGLGERWAGFGTKFLAYERALGELLGHGAVGQGDLVMLLDAWDTVVLGAADELHGKVAALLPPDDGSPWVLCGAESVCGPNHFLVGDMERLYPEAPFSWRYPNSGGLVGKAASVRALLRGLVHDTASGRPMDASENDQVRLHEFLIQRAAAGRPFPLVLDTRCEVFQCMYEERPLWRAEPGGGRIVNERTLERPVVAHGNGHTGRWFLSELYSELALLRRLGLEDGRVLGRLPHEMPVPPGTAVTEEVKAEYCPWWYSPGLHSGATDGFSTFRKVRQMQVRGS